jgi:cobalt/nickel transport system permease protein
MVYSPPALHTPDGFLSVTISIIFWLISILIVGLAVKRGQETLNQKQIPLMGIMAAFIFAAQMINFPVAGGTSGHLLGGVLAAIILGPWSGMLVMTSVVGLQAVLFQDGGLLAMGANIFNMGLLTALIGYGLYAVVRKQNKPIQFGVIGIAAWVSVLASAFFTSFQIWLSGTSPARIVFPAMLSIHALIGIGEAIITVAAFSFINQVRPDLIGDQNSPKTGNIGWIFAGGIITILVVLLSPFASVNPDGLEMVAADLGFLELAQANPFSIFSDYIIPSIENSNVSTIASGIVGIVIVSGVTYMVGRALTKSSSGKSP